MNYNDFELVDQTQVLQTLPLPDHPQTTKGNKYPPLAHSEKLRRNVLAAKHHSMHDTGNDEIYYLKGYTDEEAIISSQREIINSRAKKLDLVGSLQPLKKKKVKKVASKRRLSKITNSILNDSRQS